MSPAPPLCGKTKTQRSTSTCKLSFRHEILGKIPSFASRFFLSLIRPIKPFTPWSIRREVAEEKQLLLAYYIPSPNQNTFRA